MKLLVSKRIEIEREPRDRAWHRIAGQYEVVLVGSRMRAEVSIAVVGQGLWSKFVREEVVAESSK